MVPQITHFEREPNGGNTVARASIRFGGAIVHHCRLVKRYDGSFYLGTPSWRLPDNTHREIISVDPDVADAVVAELIALLERAEMGLVSA